MKFVKYTDNIWYEWVPAYNRLYNICGGFICADKKSIFQCQYLECKNWHELYTITHFNPLISSEIKSTGWISPDGDFYPAKAHEVEAEYIWDLLYGSSKNETEYNDCYGDALSNKGWIKVTTSLMYEIYKENGEYNKRMTLDQERTFCSWLKKYEMG